MSWIAEIGPPIMVAASALLFVVAVFADGGSVLSVQRNCCRRDPGSRDR